MNMGIENLLKRGVVLGVVLGTFGLGYLANRAYAGEAEAKVRPTDSLAEKCEIGHKFRDLNEEAKPYFDNGVRAYASGNYEKAIELYQKSAELDSANPYSFYSLGHAYEKKGDAIKSIKMFEISVKLDPCFAEAYGALGRLYLTDGKYKESIFNNTAVLQLTPNTKYKDIILERITKAKEKLNSK
jgi:tetratricopeptide (TPR) repeat protein